MNGPAMLGTARHNDSNLSLISTASSVALVERTMDMISEQSFLRMEKQSLQPTAVIDLDDSIYDEPNDTLEAVSLFLKQAANRPIKIERTSLKQEGGPPENDYSIPKVVQTRLREPSLDEIEIPHPRFLEEALPKPRLSETQLEDESYPSQFLQQSSFFGQPLTSSSLINKKSMNPIRGPSLNEESVLRQTSVQNNRVSTLGIDKRRLSTVPQDDHRSMSSLEQAPSSQMQIKTEVLAADSGPAQNMQSVIQLDDMTIPSQFLGDTTMFRTFLPRDSLSLIDEMFPSQIFSETRPSFLPQQENQNVSRPQTQLNSVSELDHVMEPARPQTQQPGPSKAQSTSSVSSTQATTSVASNRPSSSVTRQQEPPVKVTTPSRPSTQAELDPMPAIKRNVLSNILNTMETRPQDFEVLGPIIDKDVLVNSIEQTIQSLQSKQPPGSTNVPVLTEQQQMFVTININITQDPKSTPKDPVPSAAPVQPVPVIPVPPYEGIVTDHDHLFDGNMCLLHKKMILVISAHKKTKVHRSVEALIKGGEKKAKLSIQDMRDLFYPESTIRRCCLCEMKFETVALFKSHVKSTAHAACLALHSAPEVEDDNQAPVVDLSHPSEEENRRRKHGSTEKPTENAERVGKPPKRVRRGPRPRLPPSTIVIDSSDDEVPATPRPNLETQDYTLD